MSVILQTTSRRGAGARTAIAGWQRAIGGDLQPGLPYDEAPAGPAAADSYRYCRTGSQGWADGAASWRRDDRCRPPPAGWAAAQLHSLQHQRRAAGTPAVADGPSADPGNASTSRGAPDPEHRPPPAPAPPPSWVDRLPASWRPYAQLSRLDKPIGTWLLAWPCFWSIALAAPPGALPDARLIALFGAGAVLLRGAGCTVNDLWDRELDAKVERTRHRPLAAGTLTPLQATGWLAAQLAAGLGVLVQLNPYAQALGASSLALVAVYPAMKRVTGWPQAFLGLTFNWGALLGWAAARGECEWGVVAPLYLGGVCWTLVYDTIYAHQDKADDVAAGVRSTALTLGAASRRWLAGFAAGGAALAVAAGHAAGCGAPYYAGVAAGAAHLAWQVGAVDFDDPADCGAKFRGSGWYGAALFAGAAADRALWGL